MNANVVAGNMSLQVGSTTMGAGRTKLAPLLATTEQSKPVCRPHPRSRRLHSVDSIIKRAQSKRSQQQHVNITRHKLNMR